MQYHYPYQIDGRGRTRQTTEDAHVRQMIEEVLFTAPGERVNRPGFGTGLLQLVFGPNSPELAAATEFMIQGALQQWLGNVIQVESVQVKSDDAAIRVRVQYLLKRNRQRQVTTFERAL